MVKETLDFLGVMDEGYKSSIARSCLLLQVPICGPDTTDRVARAPVGVYPLLDELNVREDSLKKIQGELPTDVIRLLSDRYPRMKDHEAAVA